MRGSHLEKLKGSSAEAVWTYLSLKPKEVPVPRGPKCLCRRKGRVSRVRLASYGLGKYPPYRYTPDPKPSLELMEGSVKKGSTVMMVPRWG